MKNIKFIKLISALTLMLMCIDIIFFKHKFTTQFRLSGILYSVAAVFTIYSVDYSRYNKVTKIILFILALFLFFILNYFWFTV